MSCPNCGRKVTPEKCADGYMAYLSGDFPCPHNTDPLAAPKNLRVLPPISHTPRAPPMSSEGLEDLL